MQSAISYLIFLLIFPIALKKTYSGKRASIVKWMPFILGLFAISSFFPILPAQEGMLVSQFTLMLNGAFPFALMFLCYILAATLLIMNKPNFDFITFFLYVLALFCAYLGFFQSNILTQSFPGRNSEFIVLMTYLLVPLAFTLPLLSLIANPNKKRTGIWKKLDDWK